MNDQVNTIDSLRQELIAVKDLRNKIIKDWEADRAAKDRLIAELTRELKSNLIVQAEQAAFITRSRDLFREVLRWRDADQNDGFPHDTRLSIIEILESLSSPQEPAP